MRWCWKYARCEQVVAHAVLDAPRRVQDAQTPQAAEDVLDRGQRDHDQRKATDQIEVCSRRQRVDDAADEQRRKDRDERATGDEEDASEEFDLVLTEVVEKGRSGGVHPRSV